MLKRRRQSRFPSTPVTHSAASTTAGSGAERRSDGRGTPVPQRGDILTGRDRYRLVEGLGQGRYGLVFRAERLPRRSAGDSCAARDVAVKIFMHPDPAVRRRRLQQERAPLLTLDHPNIVRAEDWGSKGRTTFLVLPHYPQGNLLDYVAQTGPFREPTAWMLAEHLLQAVAASHAAGILHLDIKPGNVLVDAVGRFVLADFDIARQEWEVWRDYTGSTGTPGYRAPEQGREDAHSLTQRTDLWGIGITLWTACTGIEPDRSDVQPDAISAVLSDHRPDLSPALRALITTLLQTDPTERPERALAVLGGIQDRQRARRRAARDPRLEARWGQIEPETWYRLQEGPAGRLLDRVTPRTDARQAITWVEAGEGLCLEGESPFYAFLLLQGRVSLERQGRVLRQDSREGALLGAVSVLKGQARAVTVRAVERTWVYCLEEQALEQLMMAQPALGLRLLSGLTDHQRGLERVSDAAAPLP